MSFTPAAPIIESGVVSAMPTLAPSITKVRNCYPKQCKEIVLHVNNSLGPCKTAQFFDISRTLIPRWKKCLSIQLPLPTINAPSEDKDCRDMDIIIDLQIHERSNKENLEVYRHLVQMPPVKKAKITARTKSSAKQIEEFGEFFAIDGCGEEYLHLLEKIDESQLDERISLQIDKVIDSSVQGPARELMEHSLNYAIDLRGKNKAKSTNSNWRGRKRNFLVC